MTFNRLPDPERYPHPRLSWLIECGFDVVTRAMYRREAVRDHGRPTQPGMLIVSNHQRDSDVPILATFLCRRRGARIIDPLPFFAMREDLFRRGALGTLLAGWPRPLAHALGRIPLDWLFRNVRAWPMRRIGEFSWGETLDALREAGFGEAHPATLFNSRGQRELCRRFGTLPSRLADITPAGMGALRTARWGLRRLQRPVLRQLAPAFRATIGGQLDAFVEQLDAGERVYFCPEGCVSPHGAFGRVRAGAWQLCRRAREPVPVLPCTISYDALAPGRLRAVVHVGEPAHGLDALDARSFALRMRELLLAQYPVTPSHLLAHYLSTRPGAFSDAHLTDWLKEARDTAAARGHVLDPLFGRSEPDVLVQRRLRWLRRRGLVVRDGAQWRNAWPDDARPGWRDPAAVVRYLANSLHDLSPGLTRDLAP